MICRKIFIQTLCLGLMRQAWSQSCSEFTIPVNISARNKVLPSNLTAADINLSFIINQVASFESTLIGGQYDIFARYCEPLVTIAERQNTLQVLVHGGTYTRNYWSGLAAPGTFPGQDEYSWIRHAAQQGYPTLSIDRLCNGNSSHPDGIAVCQFPIQTEALHAVITTARAGKLPSVSIPFSKIIVISHSFGSLLANELANTYPSDIDGLILTGFTDNLLNGALAIVPIAPLPATIVNPSAYSGPDLSYVSVTNQDAVRDLFYYGSYEESIFQYDYAHRGTLTLGEAATFYEFGQLPVPGYLGPLFVLDGNEDAAFCQLDPIKAITEPIGPDPNCTIGYSAAVHSSYPAVSRFDFHNTLNTGHCLNLHTTASQSFAAAHAFLQDAGF